MNISYLKSIILFFKYFSLAFSIHPSVAGGLAQELKNKKKTIICYCSHKINKDTSIMINFRIFTTFLSIGANIIAILTGISKIPRNMKWLLWIFVFSFISISLLALSDLNTYYHTNRPPKILSVIPNCSHIFLDSQEPIYITARAYDRDGDKLEFDWNAQKGNILQPPDDISSSAQMVRYTQSDTTWAKDTVNVYDNKGGMDSKHIYIYLDK